MSDPGEANKIDQPLEATIDDAEPILPDPIHTNSPKPAPQDEDRENPTLPTSDPPVSRGTSSTLSDSPPIHEIRRSARSDTQYGAKSYFLFLCQNTSPKLTSAYLTNTNPHFPQHLSESLTHVACLAQTLESDIEEPKSYKEALTCAEWK